jgi:hypothetical protein
MPRHRGLRIALTLGLAGTAMAGLVGPGASPAAAVTPVPNPPIVERCGVDITLVLDASGSIQTSNAVNNVRDAAEAFLDALSNTGSTARVTQFATLTQQLAPSTVVDDNTLGPGGALRDAIDKYYNPRPQRPSNVNFINTSGQVNNNESNNQYTNWDGSLNQAADTKPDLVVYVTDGDPTAYDLDKPGDPGDPGPPPDVRYGTSSTDTKTNDRAIEEANRIKGPNGSRMLVVGVGNALSSQASVNRLIAISGPQVARDADLNKITSLNQVDVALVTKFTDLAAFLRHVVLQLCSPSLTIQKLAQTAGSAAYAPAQGWDMTVTPRALPPGTGFNWILPNTTPAASKTVSTNANGFAQFQWEPIPPASDPNAAIDSAATVSEALKGNHTPGRPGPNNDFSCDLKDEDGNVRTVTGELNLTDPNNPSFDLNPIGQEIVTCKVYNSYNYAPAIHLAKVNTPTELRGDLADNPNPGDPPASVTSNFTVTNPGNTPLSNVSVTDSECGPVAPVPATGTNNGDTDGDGLLDVGEAWQFRCVRDIETGASTNPAGQTITNTATTTGTDPVGTLVTDDATDDVTAFNPAISIVKQVNGVDVATITPPAAANYTYDVSNTGNTPLQHVALEDATTVPNVAACSPIVRGAAGNGDQILDVGETWHFTCSNNPTEDVVDTATVSADPVNPVTGNPFAGRNPPVTASDNAAVVIVNPAIRLEKVANPTQVVVDANGGTAKVTYTFTATNPGNAPLNRPGAPPAGTGPSATDPGWVVDPRCDQPTTYTGGDADGDKLLDPGETWKFTCTNTVSDNRFHLVPNVAVITGQPSNANGQPLPGINPVHDFAAAVVRVLTPGIDVVKTSLRPTVLDPGAPAVVGPDVPTPRPAQYTYDVSNTGTVPLDLSPDPPTDTKCSPLVPATPLGDSNANGLLDPDEVWHYTCETTLSLANANGAGNVVNTVTASGVPDVGGTQFPGLTVSDDDTATVHVIKPGLSITKTASPTAVLAGRDVTYTFAVANAGNAPLSNVVPVDDKCSPLVPESPFGDSNGDGLLDPDEVWHYTCTREIDLPPSGTTTDRNTASVTGVDSLGNTYRDQDTALVKVIDPAIHLEKSVSDSLVLSGSRVRYTFEVTNTGQSPVPEDDVLDSVHLGDVSQPANPGCRHPELVAKQGGNQDDLLTRDPAEKWVYQCHGTITKRTVDLAGVRALGGSTIGARVPVFDFATAQVTPFHPGISVEKTASPSHLEGGGKVTYTYRVRNTGDVPLADVADRISDDTCSPVRYVTGDKDKDGLLDSPHSLFEDSLDETWVFTCTTFVDKDTTNTVVVSGVATGPDGPLCTSSQDAARAAGKPTCEPADRDTAHVTVAPATGPVTGNNPPPPGTLPNTGGGSAPDSTDVDGVRELLGLSLFLVLVGSALVAWSVRRRRQPAA